MLVGLVTLAGSLGVLSLDAIPSGAQPAFGQAIEVDPPANAPNNSAASFSGISCVSVGNCVAVGSYRDGVNYNPPNGFAVLLAATETGGTWAQPGVEVGLPTNVGSNPGAGLNGVSCTSAGNCVAVGGYYDTSAYRQALVATETNGTWGQHAAEVTPPGNVYTGGNPNVGVDDVICTSAGNCVAVGGYTDSSGHSQAMVVTETDGTWGTATEITPPGNVYTGGNPGVGLGGVSCTSAGNCVAVGGYHDASNDTQALVVTETDGTWAQATEITAPTNASGNFGGSLSGVSCTSAGNCVAVGGYADSSGHSQALVATETGGTWAQATGITAPSDAESNPSASLGRVSCPSIGNCVAVGGYTAVAATNWHFYRHAMVATEADGTWGQAVVADDPANAIPDAPTSNADNTQGYLSGVWCSATGDCTTAGMYAGVVSSVDTDLAMVADATSSTSLAAPTGLVATPGSVTADLSWSAVAGAASYTVYDATSPGGENYSGTPVCTATAPATTCTVSGLTAGTTYYFTVVASGGWAASAPSGEVSARTTGSGGSGGGGSGGSAPTTPTTIATGGSGVAGTPDGKGYWVIGADGSVTAHGTATGHGSMSGHALNAPVIGIAATPNGNGYWLVASDGGVFAFGNAGYYGSMGGHALNAPVIGIAATPNGNGYWLVASDGGVFAFGNAAFSGSMGGHPLHEPVVGIATSGDGTYWLVAADGGVFAFGGAPYDGSMGGQPLNEPIVGIAANPSGGGYWLVAADGGVFAFGGAPYDGSLGGSTPPHQVVGIVATANGYALVDQGGASTTFGA